MIFRVVRLRLFAMDQRSAGKLKFCPATAPPRPAKCILQEMIFSKNSASLITTILFHEMNKIDMIYIHIDNFMIQEHK